MNGNYLIPANSKKSMLIFGIFDKIDIWIFGTGVITTLLLLVAIKAESLIQVVIVLTPLLVAAFLIMPVPNYHNMRIVITELWQFYTTRQQYVWKGWCAKDGSDKK